MGLDRAVTGRAGTGASQSLVVMAVCGAIVLSACSGGSERPAGAAQTSASTANATTTAEPPTPEPPTTAERRWVKQVHKIRPRIDKVFQRNLNITRSSMQSLVRVLGACKATLKEAGHPGTRLAQAVFLARKACDRYGSAAKKLQQAIAVSDVSGAVIAGTPEEAAFGRALDQAFAAQANGSNRMLRGEEKADHLLASIEAESSE